MNAKNSVLGLLLVAGLVALPVSSMAATSKPCSCLPGKATPESYKWNFRAEASGLLDQVQADAMQAHGRAGVMKAFDMQPGISWEAQADQLTAVKREVNDIGVKLCRLEQIRRVVAPWQQQAIDRIAPQVQLIADSAEDAINYLNDHQGNFWVPTYRKYTDNIYQESARIDRSVKNLEEYAKVHEEDLRLQKSLGVKVGA